MASRKKTRKPARRAGPSKKSARRPVGKRKAAKRKSKPAKRSAKRVVAKRAAKRSAKKAVRRPAPKKKKSAARKAAVKAVTKAAPRRPQPKPKQVKPSPADIAPVAAIKPVSTPKRSSASWPASNYTPAVEQPKPVTGSLWPEDEDQTEEAGFEGTVTLGTDDSDEEEDEMIS